MGFFSVDNLKKIISTHEEYDVKTYIETGTWQGDQVLKAAQVFDTVYGIELNEHWFNVSVDKNSEYENVHMIHGDTQLELPKLLEKHKDTPLFILLDAHFFQTDPPLDKSFFPLWKELDMIRKRDVRDIIAIDDVHTFGRKRSELKIDQNVKEWEDVTTSTVLNFFGDSVRHSELANNAFIVWR